MSQTESESKTNVCLPSVRGFVLDLKVTNFKFQVFGPAVIFHLDLKEFYFYFGE